MSNNKGFREIKLILGNSDAFLDWFDRCYDHYYLYVITAIKSRDLTDMILEESFHEIWKNRETLDMDIPIEEQLLDIMERRVFSVLRKAASDPALKEMIFLSMEQPEREITNLLDEPIESQDENSMIKVIHNNILRKQLLHKLGTASGD